MASDSADDSATCTDCNNTTDTALTRTIRLTVDRSPVDTQRLCPDCFAEWIDDYKQEMQPTDADADSEILID